MSKRKRKVRLLIVLTAINILLFIGSIFSLIRTSKNNKIINSFCGDFNCREEGKGEILLTLRSGKEMNLRFEKSSVKVVGAYDASEREECLYIVKFIYVYAKENGCEIPRAKTEMYGEYRLHNILYGLGYKREQTADSDLDYEKDKRWYVNAASKILGFTGW